MARQILHAIFVQNYSHLKHTHTHVRARVGLLDDWWLHGLVISAYKTPKQKQNERVLQKGIKISLFDLFAYMCIREPRVHIVFRYIAKLNCVTHKQNEMKESVQTAALIVIPAKITEHQR